MKLDGDHSYQAKFPVKNTLTFLRFSNKWLQITWNAIQESCGLVLWCLNSFFLVPIHFHSIERSSLDIPQNITFCVSQKSLKQHEYMILLYSLSCQSVRLSFMKCKRCFLRNVGVGIFHTKKKKKKKKNGDAIKQNFQWMDQINFSFTSVNILLNVSFCVPRKNVGKLSLEQHKNESSFLLELSL